MKNLLHLLTLFACATATSVFGQIELKLELAVDGTYTAIARSNAELVPPLDNITHSAQVVVTMPTGGFELASLVSHAGQWQLTNLVQRPIENPRVDYALFSLASPTDAISYPAGQEVRLFSFQNDLGCTGKFDIMDPTNDPFLPPNSFGLPVFSKFIIAGTGQANAVVGRYDEGQANCFKTSNCLIHCELELMPDDFYQISLTTDAAFSAPGLLDYAQVSIRLPTNFFQIHNLTNLLPGYFSFGNTSRQDSPVEDNSHDYITFRMNATGNGLDLLPGTKTPILRFANRGSCQGDSIFLVKNDDPFLPPNSQSANLGHVLRFGGAIENIPICNGPLAAAPCVGCQFTDGLVKLDSVQSTDPVVCLGGMNGTVRLFAHGSPNLEYSVDGGQNWSNNPHFTGLGTGSYQPLVRGLRFGCLATTTGQPLTLQAGTMVALKLEAPSAVCEGEDVQFKIMSPSPLPVNASLTWTGPQGFQANFADPVIFDVNNYQSGDYTLLLQAPGCDPATAVTYLAVNALPAVPDLVSNGPICFGDKVKLYTTAKATAFDWYGPLGGVVPALSTVDSVLFIDKTMDLYASGNWQLKITDEHGCTAMSTPAASLIKPRPQAFAETGGSTCPGGTAQLFANPLPNASYEWRRQGEVAIFSTQPNLLINNVLAAETYSLLVWRDGCVSSVPALATVSISQPPSIAPQQLYTPATNCAPKPLSLSANAAGVGLSYTWAGPNGFTSQADNPVIAAANSAANGSYTVQVRNVFGCSATESVVVAGIPDPVAQPQVQGSGPACPGEDVTLSVQPYAAPQVGYQWIKGTLPMLGQNSNSLIFNSIQSIAEGNYKLRVTVGNCVVESANHWVDVLEKPQVNPDFYLSQPCEGGTLQFYSNLTGITDWRWTGPAGFTSDSPTPVIYQTRLTDIGAYQLTVTGLNGCSSSASLVVDGILPVPEAPLVASNSPICPGSEMVLTVQNPSTYGSFEFVWMNANGEPIGSSQATLTLAINDSLAVPPFLVNTIVNGCSSPLSDPVQVTVLPDPVALAWHGGAVCEGGAAQLFAASQPGVSYAWRSGGQVVSLEQNPVLALTDTTDFQLVVKTNGCAAEATANLTVPVNPAPVITDIATSTAACEGNPVSLSANNSVPVGGTVQYNWTGPGGFSFTGSAASAGPFPLAFNSFAPQNEGSYTLTLTSTEGCVSAPQSVAVEVGQIPATPTVTVADAQLCEGETLQLDASPATGNSVGYDWYFNDQWLVTTANPTYLAAGATLSQSGNYSVKTTLDGCQSPPSNLVPVSIIALPTGALANNPTSSLAPACEGSDVALAATLLPGASYHWYGPLGFFANVPNPVLDGISAGQAGDYLVVIGYPQCSATLAFETAVFVSPTPQTPVLAGATTACEGEDVVLSIANSEAGAVYDYYFGQNGQPFQTGGDEAVLTNISAAQNGGYFASASLNGCESMLSAPINLQVFPAQTGTAFAGDDQTVCEANETPMLHATPPTVGAGHWVPLDGATVVQPASAHSTVLGLQPGENRFVWNLTNGFCPGVGSDTAVVFLENVKAVEDFYSMPLNDSLLNINLLENDFIQNMLEWDFRVLTTPTKGRLVDGADGTVSYAPYPNAFGEDGFRYRLCSLTCPDVCDEAVVRISLDGSVAAEDCFRPNLITPDGDGMDDVFVIPCAAGWPGSSLLIFNRWGATVFETKDYQNDWGGTYNGQPLPPGTYFYQLRLADGKWTVLQGFVAIN
ncbi:MAG: gliding motility-associated C-terminal domain-containing protein [Saprospiraceae bacterium]|nr:gliding motility-associated C-terminal domain-containing protein [Saprospiraceae bacterium]